MARELSWGSVILNILVAPTIAMIFVNYAPVISLGLYCGEVVPLLSREAVYALVFITAFLYGIIYDRTPYRTAKALALGVGSVLSTFSLYTLMGQFAAFRYAVDAIGKLFLFVADKATVAFMTFAAWLLTVVAPFLATGTFMAGALAGAIATPLLTAGILIIMAGVALYDMVVGKVWQQAVFNISKLVADSLGVGLATPFLVWIGTIMNIIMYLPVYIVSFAFGIFVIVFIVVTLASAAMTVGALVGAALAAIVVAPLTNQLSAAFTGVARQMSAPVLLTMTGGFAASVLILTAIGYLTSILVYTALVLPVAAAAAVLLVVLTPNIKRLVGALSSTFSFLVLIQFILTVLSAFANANMLQLGMCTLDSLARGQYDTSYIVACGVCGGPPVGESDPQKIADYLNCVQKVQSTAADQAQKCMEDMARHLSNFFGLGGGG